MCNHKAAAIVLVLFMSIPALVALNQLGNTEPGELGLYTRVGPDETGAINQVTAILFDYRSLDTLGEATVIFAAAAILAFLAPRRRTSMLGVRLSPLVHYGVALILPFVLVFGFYIILFGHISPGGGFTGGVVLAASAIVFAITYSAGSERKYIMNTEAKKRVESFGMLTFLAIGLIGVGAGSWFLANAQTGIGLGRPGAFLSGGWIPVLNLASGLKVGAGLAIIFVSLARED